MSNQYLLDEDRQNIQDMIQMATIIEFDDVVMDKAQVADIVAKVSDHDLASLFTEMQPDGKLIICFG